MSATVQYIGNEGTAVLAVDNFMRHVDAVKRYVTEKAVSDESGRMTHHFALTHHFAFAASPVPIFKPARLGRNY